MVFWPASQYFYFKLQILVQGNYIMLLTPLPIYSAASLEFVLSIYYIFTYFLSQFIQFYDSITTDQKLSFYHFL